MGKTRAKKPRRKRKSRGSRSGNKRAARPALWGVAIAMAMCILLWLAYAGFEDRHWSAFQNAGDRAYGRGNYAYAQRMYHEALQEAERLDPRGEELVQTLLALSRTHKASGEQTLADAMLTRACAVRAQRKR